MRPLIVLAALALVATPAAAQTYKAPRTPWGHPDLQGVWNTSFILPLEARDDAPNLIASEEESKRLARKVADEFYAMAVNNIDSEVTDMWYASARNGLAIVRGQRRTRAIVEPANGKLPLTPNALREVRAIENSVANEADPRQFADGPEQRAGWERCVSLQGAPPITVLNDPNPRNIVQTRDHIVIHTEYGDEARIVPFTKVRGPPPPAPMATPTLGDAIAWWEGETLVIETIRLPRSQRIRIGPVMIVPYTAKVIEKYTRVAKGELLYQYTVIEPTVYAGPWLAEFSLYPQTRPMYEFACHEGNYSLPNILRGARLGEKEATAARAKAAN